MSDFIGDFKIILIGDGGTGKSTFITRFIKGNFDTKYIATIGAETFDLILTTTDNKQIRLVLWDTAGQEKNSGLSDAYYINSHGALCFFDLTSRVTLKNVHVWHRKVMNISEIPFIVIGNKADVKDRKITPYMIKKGIPSGGEYVEMSTRTNYNFDQPLLKMVRILTGDSNLMLAPSIHLMPTVFTIDQEAIQQSQAVSQQIEAAKYMELPDDFQAEDVIEEQQGGNYHVGTGQYVDNYGNAQQGNTNNKAEWDRQRRQG